MFDFLGVKALKAQCETLRSKLAALEYTINGSEGEFGIVQHIHGTGKPGQEGLWGKLKQLEQQNAELQKKVAALQNLEELVRKALQQNPEQLVKLYDAHRMEQLLIEAVNKQLGERN